MNYGNASVVTYDHDLYYSVFSASYLFLDLVLYVVICCFVSLIFVKDVILKMSSRNSKDGSQNWIPPFSFSV